MNVAFAFDELRNHEGKPLVEKPKEHECDVRRRLEQLIVNTPFIWSVTSQSDLNQLANDLSSRFEKLLEYLNQIDSLSRFIATALEKQWFAMPGEYDLMARMYDAMGKNENAKECKRLYSEFLDNRAKMSHDELLKYYISKI